MIDRIYRLTNALGQAFLVVLASIYGFLARRFRSVAVVAVYILRIVLRPVLFVLDKVAGRFLRWYGRQILAGLRLLRRMAGDAAFRLRALLILVGIRMGIIDPPQQETLQRFIRIDRDNITPAQMAVLQDPLHVQNRRLTWVIMSMGLVMIGVLAWSSDNFGSQEAEALAPNSSFSRLLATPEIEQRAPIVADLSGQNTDIVSSDAGRPSVLSRDAVSTAFGGVAAFTLRDRAQSDIWAVQFDTRQLVRLTDTETDERDPAWSPDGLSMAYTTRVDNNWELYLYDLRSDSSQRLTQDLSYQGKPSWSPDSRFIAYESYQADNLDIYAMPVDGSSPPIRLTEDAEADMSPVWLPTGRQLVFVSLRDGNRDLYVVDLDTLAVYNLTRTPDVDESDPQVDRNGSYLTYTSTENGNETVFVQSLFELDEEPIAIGFGHSPNWVAPEQLIFETDARNDRWTYLTVQNINPDSEQVARTIQLPYGAHQLSWVDSPAALQRVTGRDAVSFVAQPPYTEQVVTYDEGAPYRLSPLLNLSDGEPQFLSDQVDDSFNALRQDVERLTGVDYLADVSDTWWSSDRLPQSGETRINWHYTGRAFQLDPKLIQGTPPAIEVVQETVGTRLYWRVYLRVFEDAQFGQYGEPLMQLPWDFFSRVQGDVSAYENGGRLRSDIPAGYYIDLTQLAADYGWERLPANPDWRNNVNGLNHLFFHKPDGLDWQTAMLEIYPQDEFDVFAEELR